MFYRMGKVFLVRFNWQRLFEGRMLLLTNTMTAGIISCLGDIAQQKWEIYKKPDRVIDWKRQADMFVIGCSFGPPLHFWYKFLDKVFAGKTVKTVCKKVLLDQVIGSPLSGLWFFIGMAILEGHTLSKGWNECREKFWELYVADCCLWIPTQAFNFFFLKPKYRVAFLFSVAFVWDIYLSYIKYRDQNTELVSDSSAVDVEQEDLPPSKPLEDKA